MAQNPARHSYPRTAPRAHAGLRPQPPPATALEHLAAGRHGPAVVQRRRHRVVTAGRPLRGHRRAGLLPARRGDAHTLRRCAPRRRGRAGPERRRHRRAQPEVAIVRADEASGAPPSSWGERFFFVGPERRRPFATLVEHDTTGFDDESQLDRPGVFRLNIEIGREEFQRRFGYPPARFADNRSSVDFTALDQVIPHPVYGTHGWACVLNPGPGACPGSTSCSPTHREALRRHHRSLERRHRPG
ncbi:DUF6194 family protein [Micromonospora deserti]|uniref:DUF6194 family protein n=1 Tax=Micromonospora deserti TaxID=2070366 RepID=UPI003F69F772